jgi:hypothetical protein
MSGSYKKQRWFSEGIAEYLRSFRVKVVYTSKAEKGALNDAIKL